MPHVPNNELRQFDQALRTAYRRVGGGKIAVDSDAVRAAVRSHSAAAYRFVELHCYMAAGQPGYLQPALIVAGAYEAEFKDKSLVDLVMSRAEELDAMEYLESIGTTSAEAQTSHRPKSGSTILVQCTGRDGKPCSLIQLEGVTQDQLRRGIDGRCPACGKKFRVDSTNTAAFHLD